MQPSELAARVYRFLSLAYLNPPETEYLKAVSQWCASLLAHGEDLPGGVAAGLQRIQSALEPDISDGLVLSLQEEFVRLLRSPSPLQSPPPPYESVYREGTLWGAVTPQVLKQYGEWGLEPADSFRGEPPDHVGLELQFMASLCELEAQAVCSQARNVVECRSNATPLHYVADYERSSELQKAQREFLQEHLGAWFPMFRERALAYEPHPFYEGVLMLTERWLHLHTQYLSACL